MIINSFSVFITLFFLSLLSLFLNKKNILIMLMSLEIIFLSTSFMFIYSSIFLDDLKGQIFSLIILTVAAAESSIGLSILVIYYRIRYNINIEFMNLLKG
uniref:NADH dehydrogenase subunit 4L n=1 Tax=Choreocolax polysiphoniae TaxID=282351 RepID=A0A1J0F7B0_9FLOR|nr:NADH dehydrogenase subunit 4L [Choreocolax polysiphoniae]APC24868.1 NADH dehydrogenase subunit 4L [Choreocolax polysiphoniae]